MYVCNKASIALRLQGKGEMIFGKMYLYIKCTCFLVTVQDSFITILQDSFFFKCYFQTANMASEKDCSVSCRNEASLFSWPWENLGTLKVRTFHFCKNFTVYDYCQEFDFCVFFLSI